MRSSVVFIISTLAIVLLASCQNQTTTSSPQVTVQITSPINTSTVSLSPETNNPVIIPTSVVQPSPSPLVIEYIQAPIVIDKTFNGREIHANLVKFTGTVSSPNATVVVNEVQATVNADGSYYAYLDLDPGKNNIVIKITKNDQVLNIDQIVITFSPPLIVVLGWPVGDPEDNSDYTKVPFKISGRVSDSAARVEINQKPIPVMNDGTFSTQSLLKVGHNHFNAIALRGDERDTAGVDAVVLDNGKINPSPPPGLGAGSSFAYFGDNNNMNPIHVKIGEITTTNVGVLCNKDLFFTKPDSFRAYIYRNSQPHMDSPGDKLPLPTGLTVSIVPSSYKLYSKIEYHSLMVIASDSGLVPGEYFFTIDYRVPTGHGYHFTTILAEP